MMRWQTPTIRTLDEDRATFIFRAVEAKRTPLTDRQRRARRQSLDRALTGRREGGAGGHGEGPSASPSGSPVEERRSTRKPRRISPTVRPPQQQNATVQSLDGDLCPWRPETGV